MQPKKETPTDTSDQRDAAANIVRDQIDALYSGQTRVTTAASEPAAQATTTTTAPTDSSQAYKPASSWQQYHAQWQDYYQKYYERYYVGALHQAIAEKPAEPPRTPDEKKDAELVNLREKIVGTAKQGAKKARKSRHFIPFATAFVVVGVVAFLQYNEVIFANVQAYVSPGAINPQNIVVDPTSSVTVPADPKLVIPKINVDVPVIYNVAYDHDAQMAAMQKGVANFSIPGADSKPGQIGNTVFSGHSSNDLFEPGNYKFVFAQLDKLDVGDTIYVNYNSVRYTYSVTKKQVVTPTNVQALYGYTDKPYLTLITCTPLGTSTNRLLITAEQISPDPGKASAANTFNTNAKATMPDNGPTALEKLFGAKG
ncbi:MAG: putative sortase [Candidatus Saccharibacteria bacterium]|nr:putative sortase [Candidatus Saccharibacteria bacterium]